MTRARFLVPCLALVCGLPLRAQEASNGAEAAIRAFVDCQTFGCRGDAFDHFRREIGFVTWVRDRQVADVQILITSERTGAGGQLYTLAFLGRDRFGGVSDTLTATVQQQATDDDRRNTLTRVLRAGFVPYVARTALLDRLAVTLDVPADAGVGAAQVRPLVNPADDPWDFWVFDLEGNVFLNGESRTSFRNYFWSVRANRITEEWKVRTSVHGSYNESNFDLDEGTFTSIERTYMGNATFVRSLGDHWSAGARSSVAHSTRFNRKVVVSAAPAVEYNVYPYAESTRRQLIVQYSAGLSHYNWIEETIFDRTRETHADHSLVVGVEQRQPWGTVDVTLSGEQLLDDLDKYSLSIGGSVGVRVLTGLSFRVRGRFSQIRDQIFLPKSDATEEEILLQRRQLETDFSYFASLGFEYTFGSIFNTVVNPRLDRDNF